MTEEAKIVHNIISFCNKYGKAIKLHGSQYMEKGTPDLVGGMLVKIHGGKDYTYVHFLVEVKIPGRKPTRIQQKRLKEWEDAGYYTKMVDNLSDFQDFIRESAKLSQYIFPVEWLGDRKAWDAFN